MGIAALQREVTPENPLQRILTGQDAFYKSQNYLETTGTDFASRVALPTSYTWNTEHRIITIAKEILSYLSIAPMIYNWLHSTAGRMGILPASDQSHYSNGSEHPNILRENINLQSDWKYKRLTIEVDGDKVDTCIMGKASTLGNRRWTLSSNGNAEFYEAKLGHPDFQNLLNETNSNALVFNYPGVGASMGSPSRKSMTKAYRAMLAFLEDQENGIGAREIIGYGHSIGGGAQGDALREHTLKDDINYVFIKSRTFSDLSKTVATMVRVPFISFFVKLMGWNIDSVYSSKILQAPEVILQTADVERYTILSDSQRIIHDGVIAPEASLAKALLDDPDCPQKNKTFIGIPEPHNEPLSDMPFLASRIEQYLSR